MNTENSNPNNYNTVDFEIPLSLQEIGISKITKQKNTVSIKYKEHTIRFQIHNNDYGKTIKSFEKFSKEIIDDQNLKSHLLGFIAEKYNELSETKSTTNKQEESIKIEKFDGTFEEWQKQLKEKYDNLKKVVLKNFPELWISIEFILSSKNIMHISDCTLPFCGIILGAPSSMKTLGIELLRNWLYTYYTDNFSAKSFVSHNTSVSKERLEEIDLLPKIKDRVFLAPELSPLFSKKDDELLEILGILIRILDGKGYESDSGAHGHRGYVGEYMFVMVGAAVDIPRKVYKQLTNLGPKLFFFRMPKIIKTDNQYLMQIKESSFKNKFDAVKQELWNYLKFFESCPFQSIATVVNDNDKENKRQDKDTISNQNNNNNLPIKIPWNTEKDDEDALRIIVRLGRLLSNLRGAVTTYETQGTQGSQYGYSVPTIEEPSRAITQLTNLARGHALVEGRNYITLDDIPVLIKTVLSTASIERVSIFDLLLNNKGHLSTSNIVEFLGISKSTIHRTMTELKVLGLADMDQDLDSKEFKITLKDEFSWFLSQEFQKLRDGFLPQDYSEHLRKEKLPPSEQENSVDVGIQNNEHHLSKYDKREVKENLSNIEDKEKLTDIIDNNTIFTCSWCDYQTTQNLELKLHRIEKHQPKLKELDSSLINIENETQRESENGKSVNDFGVAAA